MRGYDASRINMKRAGVFGSLDIMRPLFVRSHSRPCALELEKGTSNGPLAFLNQCVANFRRDRAIAIEVGDRDGLRADTLKLPGE